eukprot:CAMPEP_0198584526 /NCGR_PEP_ID=MMETSP1462-20131121/128142_1 /TAXON_ID=1333877 /ORGANISM="Brandtodinium nutriculum, Strain RCC3387" /LENGTH=35 /DNA_ID= /DNA_START= /DNA_END= /DNA_ORIENTATION=
MDNLFGARLTKLDAQNSDEGSQSSGEDVRSDGATV